MALLSGMPRNLADATDATIYKNTNGDLIFNAGGSFIMNLNDKLVVTEGNLIIMAGAAAELGDLAVRDNITVTAPSIVLLLRSGQSLDPNAQVLVPLGTLIGDSIQLPRSGSGSNTLVGEDGLDIIAGGKIRLVGVVTTSDPLGTGLFPRFADIDGEAVDGLDGAAISFLYRKVGRALQHGGSLPNDFGLPGNTEASAFGGVTPFDLSFESIGVHNQQTQPLGRIVKATDITDPFGRVVGTTTDISASIAGFLPTVKLEVAQEAGLASATEETLRTFGIDPRPPTAPEAVRTLIGSFYDDIPYKPVVVEGDLRVVTSRLPPALAEEVADLITQVFYVGEDDRFDELRTLFATAREDYEDQLETDPSPGDFKKYLRANAEKYGQTLDTLDRLGVLFDKVDLMGLNDLELRKAEGRIVRNIASPLLGEDEFVSLIKAEVAPEAPPETGTEGPGEAEGTPPEAGTEGAEGAGESAEDGPEGAGTSSPDSPPDEGQG